MKKTLRVSKQFSITQTVHFQAILLISETVPILTTAHKRHLTQNGILYNNKIYIFQFNTTESKSQDYLPIVGQIVQSVEFLPNVPESSELTNEVSSSNQSSQNCENIPPANATASAFETKPKD